MPLRQGGEIIPHLFNIKGKKDFSIKLYEPQYSNFNTEFQEKINELKPYLFALRFKSYVKDKNSEIKALNESKIYLVKELSYDCPSLKKNNLELEDYDFISDLDSNIYFIKVPDNSNFYTMPQFIDSLTEIISIIFNLTDDSRLNDFRLIITRMNVLESLTNNGFLLDEEIDDSKKYCNLQYTFEFGFWNSLYSEITNGENLPEMNWDNTDDLADYFTTKFTIQKPSFNITDFNSNEGVEYLKMLKERLNVDIKTLLKKNRISIQNFNVKLLRDAQSRYEKQFIKKWWDECTSDENKQKSYFDRIYKYRNIIDTFISDNISELIDKVKYDFNFNANEILLKLIDKYTINPDWNPIHIDTSLTDFPEIRELDQYKDYLKFKNEKNKYLFYFDGNLKKIVSENNEKNEETASEKNESKPTAEWGTGAKFNDDGVHKNKKGKSHGSHHDSDSENDKKGKSHGSHHDSDSENDKKVGKTAEEIVIQFFKDNGYSFIDRRGESGESNSDDSFHYDFEYWKNEETHRYLEVKHDGEIYMSNGEKEFGLNFENKAYYDLALVDTNTKNIKFINKFFDFDELTETFENNNKFTAIPVKYKIETKFIKL